MRCRGLSRSPRLCGGRRLYILVSNGWDTGAEGEGERALCRSPEHFRDRDQPECFAKACSMWSRKPIPESTKMVWDPEVWAAWASPVGTSSGKIEKRLPPSSESPSWILVSLVSRTW